MEGMLPQEYYISALPNTFSRSSIFRPKQLGDLIFPAVGMIMYPLYWCKYFLYLTAQGYRQENPLWLSMTFFVALDNHSKRENSYQDSTLFLILRNALDENSRKATEIGSEWASRTPRGWLFIHSIGFFWLLRKLTKASQMKNKTDI